MKSYTIFSIIFFICLTLMSCKKTVIISHDPASPAPTDPANQRSFTIAFESLPDYHNTLEGLTVAITVEPSGSGKAIHISANLAYDQQYRTSAINLPKGTYRIKGLIIKNQQGYTLFATPVAGSAKANLVNKPLSVNMVLDQNAEQLMLLQVLAVNATDIPQSFGYSEGSFGNRTGDPDSEMDRQILVRPIIRVGHIIYDSIPAQLIVKSWNAKNEMTYNIHFLKGGAQGIYLSAKAIKHQLSISKWGSYDEFTLNKEDIQEGSVYDIGGDVEAKKLKSVLEYKIVNGISTPITKTDYEYHSNGLAKQKQVWGKRSDFSTHLVQKDIYEYINNKIGIIKSYDENNVLIKTTTVQYQNTANKISSIEEKTGNQTIHTEVTYTPLETRSGITQDYRIDAATNNGPGFPMTYLSKTMRGGSVLTDVIATENGPHAEGLYEYDFCVNPYAHLGIPDRQFLLYEKHNLKFQWKTWIRGYPENEPYTFNYTYDGDGYPKDLLNQYRNFQTKKDTYAIRTMYVYY
ncbi:hypothetical protein U0035_08670 [Niabella yanshanensis]|uniref:DUF4906 domain-containing protein n=1 Tax=Niabella yanshanensis TaxID=577386 RepID=A0ABZ0WAN7_9BACT|nr:hypothetical protein [Niabella yanshanensis]WQD40216.1 hypothetical protein U0035_08670 [Niabella yanshanensis]